MRAQQCPTRQTPVEPLAAYARPMHLSGPWLAAEADDDVRRNGIGTDTDDSGWTRLDVPGHWQDHPDFRTSDGPLMYRRSFTADPPAEGRRRWVTFDGIFYQADVWLDGAYLGDPEGYFTSHSFDVTSLSRLDNEHVLAVEVTCSPQSGTTGRRNITGIFQTPAGIGPTRNPGGLWRPVCLYDTGPVHIDRLRVLCRDADARRAHLRIATRIDSDRSDTRDDAHLRRRRHGRRTTAVDRGRPERLRVDDRHHRSCAVVAESARRPTPGPGGGRGGRRRRDQRPARAADRAPTARVGRLDLFGQRRTDLPQRRQPAADRTRPGERHPRHDPTRSGRRSRARPRCVARARPHRRSAALQGGGRGGDPAPAGLSPSMGPRTVGAPAGRRSGEGCGRLARPPSVDRHVDRPRRSRGERRGRHPRGVARSGPCGQRPSSCRHGTSRCSIGG